MTTCRDLNRPLAAVTLLMLAALGAALVGLAVDPRIITGMPAWLKPAKFALSTAVYAATLAWVFTFLPGWRRTRAFVGWTTAIVFVYEVIVIDVQAWRGTTSHFNVATPADALLFTSMGAAILFQTIASVSVAVALWRQRFPNDPRQPAGPESGLGWALRFGMTITVVGALSGGLMTRPTAAQLEEARATHRLGVSGAHTVGAPDGGPGLPVTGWSRGHGDLRVPHFLGLHALQLLALLALAIRRRHADAGRIVGVAGISYAALFAILLWQALRGEALLHPSPATLTVAAGWALATIAAAAAAARQRSVERSRRAFALNS